MAFSYINEEQKIRLTLSERARSVLKDDIAGFGAPTVAAFINTILKNFCYQAKSSIANCLEQKQLELEQLFENSKLDSTTTKKVINLLLEEEKRKLLSETECFRGQKGESRLFHINDSNLEFITKECSEDLFYSTPGQYVKSLVEEYCSLPYIERERIYHKDIYDKVEDACKNHKILKISSPYYNEKKTFHVYPYKIISDPMHTQAFLVGWSKRVDEEEEQRIIAPFSMARLNMKNISDSKQTYRLTKQRIADIELKIATESPSYFFGEKNEIHVRLSEKGKIFYNNRLASRPVIDPEKSTSTEYVFFCLEHQAFNYFSSFGAEAEIISPQTLRNRFKEFFYNANKVYSGIIQENEHEFSDLR